MVVYHYKGKVIFFRRNGTTWSMVQPPAGFTYKGTPYQLVEDGIKLKMMDPEINLIYTFNTQGLGNGAVRGVESIQDRDGNTHRLTYNQDGTLLRVEDGLGRSLNFTYISSASRRRISRVTDHAGRFIQFGYSGAQQVSFTDARGKVTRYNSNSGAQLESFTLPNGNTPVRNRYDSVGGKVIAQTDGAGHTTGFSYGAGQTTITDPQGNTVIHHFNAELRLIGLTDEAGKTVQHEYDNFHRRTATIDRLGDRSAVTYELASGKVTSRTDNEGKTWTYTYTPQQQDGFTFYNLTRIDYPDGTHEEFLYDERGNLIRYIDRAGRVWMATYNSRGQVLTITNPEGGVRTFTYNADGTLASVQDPAGNITTFAYDQFKRLIRINRPDGTQAYTWDLASRLTSYTQGLNTVSFTYDAFANRLTRSEGGRTRSYVWNYALGLPSVSIIKGEGRTTRYYIHTPGGSLLYSIEADTDARRFYHYDEMGSTLFLTNDGGAITDSYAYTPYGELTGSMGTTDNPFTYVGQLGVMHEPGTSLFYMRARYYDSATGRFLSRDPLGEDLLDVKSLNLYHYAAQNPLRFVDPMGLDAEEELGKFATIVFAVPGTPVLAPYLGGLGSLQPSPVATPLNEFLGPSRTDPAGATASAITASSTSGPAVTATGMGRSEGDRRPGIERYPNSILAQALRARKARLAGSLPQAVPDASREAQQEKSECPLRGNRGIQGKDLSDEDDRRLPLDSEFGLAAIFLSFLFKYGEVAAGEGWLQGFPSSLARFFAGAPVETRR